MGLTIVSYRRYLRVAIIFLLRFPVARPNRIVGFILITGKKVVRSGYFTLAHIEGVLGLAGFHGYNWSSHSSSTNTHTYALSINNTAIYSSGANNRYYGFPLRCLSTVLDMQKSLHPCRLNFQVILHVGIQCIKHQQCLRLTPRRLTILPYARHNQILR